MQYRHAFHAGNFADVHKHIALLQLIDALSRKAKGFLYLDTHAGEGLYDLAGSEATQGGEATAGITRLQAASASGPPLPLPLQRYLDLIVRVRQLPGSRQLVYPGSPLLAALALRDVDQLVGVESQAPVARALQRALDHASAQIHTRARVVHGDGYHEIKTHLPPVSRRGLVLIDPPYESGEEERLLTTALHAALERFESGVFAVWYPIKKRHDSDLWLSRVTRGITRPMLVTELCAHAPDHSAGLNGSGMLVINPPWQFDTDAATWQKSLESALQASGGSRVRWLRRG